MPRAPTPNIAEAQLQNNASVRCKPTIVTMPYRPDSSAYFTQLGDLHGIVWLDSGSASKVQGNHDVLSALPSRCFENCSMETLAEEVKKLTKNLELDDHAGLPFTGGVIGYLNYDARHDEHGIYKAPNKHEKTAGKWGLYEWALIQNHQNKTCIALFLPSCNKNTVDEVLKRLRNTTSEPAPDNTCISSSEFIADVSRAEYADAFKRVQGYIRDGDCYQINLAQRFSATLNGSAKHAYLKLRKHLSGAYSAFIDLGGEQILSFSPERFINIQGRQAQTKPIKGTIRRGESSKEDAQLAETLMTSAKNRAENLMIVDLLRNDFSKNCEPHSVNVPELFALESYANVHHLVSTVTGTLKQEVQPLTFFYDCFPGGSITGAPKKRAMEIIDELENHDRTIYCGSVVSLSANGHLDSSIAIRTIRVKDNVMHCWGGGGIVADSTEEEEYQESIQKVQVLMTALSK